MNFRQLITAASLAALAATGYAQTAAPPTTGTPTTGTPDAPARGTNTPLIDKHEANQTDRIKQGRESGELTKREARRLKAEQKLIDRTQNRAEADGSVSAKERSRIRHMQDRAGKDIHRQKHDGASAPATGK